ncbi:MAG: glycosyl hydrolase [Opitutaceae bacterium]|nr:glycosyl hydrolase [Opitutaceae bacterium]
MSVRLILLSILTPLAVSAETTNASPPSQIAYEDVKAELKAIVPGFSSPEPGSRPFVRWWWNGLRVSPDEIARQLDVMHRAGIGGVEINAIRMPDEANAGALAHGKLVPWLSPEWAEMVRFAADEAHKRGMTADLIVGSGWPFGGKFLEESEQTQRVRLVKKLIRGPARLTLDLDEIAARPEKDGKPPGDEVPPTRTTWAFARLLPSSAYGAAFQAGVELLPSDKESVFTCSIPEGEHLLYLGIREWGFTHVKMGAPGADGPVLNHWNASAVRRYLERMAAALVPAFGGTLGTRLRAFFVDSIELDHANWTDDLPEVFLKRCGYDVEPYLPFLLDEDAGRPEPFFSTVRRARQDFSRTLMELFEERFIRTFVAFCEEHGVKARMQAYGRETDPIRAGQVVHLPEGETWLWHDSIKETRIRVESTSANKLVSSAAHLHDQRLVSFEAMTNAVPAFRETLSDFKRATDLSFLDGLNHPILHGFNYTPPEAGYPGLVRYGCYFNERAPWWPLFPLFSDYVVRVGAVLRSGMAVAQVGILLPLADEVGHHGRLYQPFPEVRDPWYIYQLGSAVQSTGRGADYLSEEVLQASTVVNGELVYGPQHYSVVVLPEVESLELRSLVFLERFVAAGGSLLILGEPPAFEPGLRGNRNLDRSLSERIARLLKEHPGQVRIAAAPEKEAGSDALVAWSANALEPLVAAPVSWSFRTAAVSQVHYRNSKGSFIFIANTDRGMAARGSLAFPFADGAAWKLDPHSGDIFPWARRARQARELTLAPQESLLLFLPKGSDRPESSPPLGEPAEGEPISLSGPWTLDLKVAGSGETHRMSLDALVDLSQSDDPRLAGFAGVATYTTTFECAFEGPALLELGSVESAADVSLNDHHVGSWWYGNTSLPIKSGLRRGTNVLHIRVFSSLANQMRLMKEDKTAQRWAFWFKPIPTGLLGPVTLRQLLPSGNP